MFGIFYMIFSGTMATIEKVRKNIEYNNSREKANKNNDITYYGFNGERLVKNNRSVYRKKVNGEDLLVDLYNDHMYKNITKEKEECKKQELRNIGKTVIPIGYDELQKFNRTTKSKTKDFLLKPSYIDINTDQYYILVFINGIYFYMDIVTGLINRPYDEADLSKKWGTLSIDEIIKIFNDRQKKLYNIPKTKHDSIWWDKYFYLKDKYNILMIDDNKKIIHGDRNDKKIKEIKSKLINKRG